MKQILKSGARRLGGHVYTDDSLPTGVDWLHDIRRSGVLDAAPLCFDVGANVGQTVAELLRVWPQARIHAFEPFARTHAALVRATHGRPGVRALPLALGAAPGEVRASAHADSLLSSLASEPDADSAAPAEMVRIDTLDGYCAEQGITHIDVLKTDTEGYDLEVLLGARKMLDRQGVDFVYAEVTLLGFNRQNTPFQPLFDFLSERDYCFLGLYETWSMHHFAEPNVFCNALFVSRAARELGLARKATAKAATR